MTIPNITVVTRDNQLGSVSTSNQLVAVIGEATAGTNYAPTLITNQTRLLTAFTSGPLCEAAAEILEQGSSVVCVKVADMETGANLDLALTALKNTSQRWTIVYPAGLACTSVEAAKLDTLCNARLAKNLQAAWVANTRLGATPGETITAYITAISTIADSFTTKVGCLCSGGGYAVSRIDSEESIAPLARAYVAREATMSPEANTADTTLGPLPNFRVVNEEGSPYDTDALYLDNVHGSLADKKLVVARTWEDLGTGAYIVRPAVHSPVGSDFNLLSSVRVEQIGRVATFATVRTRLNTTVLCDKDTGYIKESEAKGIETQIRAALNVAIMSTPMASGFSVTVHRDDNLLVEGAEMNVDVDIVPLANLEHIKISIGFKNPAAVAA